MSRPALEYFIDREQKVWDALVAGDAEADRALLSDDFVGVYPTGFADRNDHMGALANGPTVTHYSLSHPVLIDISDMAVLLCYEAHFQRSAGDDLETMYVSSLWCRRDSNWMNTFSQDTPAGKDVP